MQAPTSLIARTTRGICDSSELAPVLSLGNQHIAGASAEPDGEQPVARRMPLELAWCDMTRNQEGRGPIQLRHTGPGAILYRSYWYRGGVNRAMTHNRHEIAQQTEELVDLHPSDLVFDIGCNDSTLLDGSRASNLRYLGFDPPTLAATRSRRATTWCAISTPTRACASATPTSGRGS